MDINYQTRTAIFEDSTELYEFISARGYDNNHSHLPMSNSFCKYSWNEALEFLNTGWKEGVTDIDVRVNEIESAHTKEAPTVQYDVEGNWIDIGAYLSGEPECMGNMIMAPAPKQTVTICVNCTASAYVQQEHIFNRGAAITAIIDQLLDKYFVDLQFTFDTSYRGGTHMIFKVDTKNMYSRELVAFYSANSAFLRRVFFMVCEQLNKEADCGSYGQPWQTHQSHTFDVYFPCINAASDKSWESKESTKINVERILQGVYEKHLIDED
jgi:hypothetical protein